MLLQAGVEQHQEAEMECLLPKFPVHGCPEAHSQYMKNFALDVCRKKWGSTGESGDDCAEVEDADSPTGLRQKPFQGLINREGSRPAARRHGRHLQELP